MSTNFSLGQKVTYTHVLTLQHKRGHGTLFERKIEELAEPVRGIITGRRRVELPNGKHGVVWLVTSRLDRSPHRVPNEYIQGAES